MNNLNRSIYCLIYVLLVTFFVYKLGNYQQFLLFQSKTEGNHLPVIISSAVFPVITGIALALPRLYRTLIKQGKWQFDWIRFLLVGIPSFWATNTYTLPAMGINLPFVPSWAYTPLLADTGGIVFGYILLNSFYKITKQNTEI